MCERFWTLPEVVHQALRQISFELIYRPLLARMPSAELDERLARHPDPIRAQRCRDAARGQASAPAVTEATASLRGVLARTNGALEHNEWLAGDSFSLADVAMAPFVERLDHLGLMDLSESFLHARRWSAAMMARPAIISARAPLEFRLPVHFPQ